MEQTAIATIENHSASLFDAGNDIDKAVQIAKILSGSSMVPAHYQGDKNIPNVLIAIEMANRAKMNPLMVMQNLYIIQGKPSWSSAFIIGLLNQSGRFEPLKFDLSGEGDKMVCYAWTILKATGERLNGPKISMVMARDEGWLTKPGSKWKSMPEVMIQYRAASFFARIYAYDLICGLYSSDEAADTPSTATADAPIPTETLTKKLIQEEAVVTAEFFEPEGEQAPTPTLEEKTELWQEYLALLGKKNHAMNAIKKVTDGRGSNEWTAQDMDSLRKDLQRRKAEAEQTQGEEYGTSVRDVDGSIFPESDVNGGA